MTRKPSTKDTRHAAEDESRNAVAAAVASTPTDEAIPFWRQEAANWRRHAARFEALATKVRKELIRYFPSHLNGPGYVDLRSNRYWWFTHMAAVATSWAARAEQRLLTLQTCRREPS